MTYEEESVTRALLKFHLEAARGAAAKLSEFQGAETVIKLNELLGLRPIRSNTPFLRALPAWGRPEGDEAA